MFIIEIIVYAVFELFLTWSGEVFLWLLTFGQRKPKWNLYEDEKPIKWAVFTERSMWIGFFGWILILYLVSLLLK